MKETKNSSEAPSNLSNHGSPHSNTSEVMLLPNTDKVEKEVPVVKKNRTTLTQFIEDNEKLINVLGVFTAITVFVSELRLQAFGYALSFMFMTLTVLLWLELWSKFPSKSGDWKITWFENILFLTVLAMLVYWLIDFRDIWHKFLLIFIFGVLSSVFSLVMKKFGVFNKLFHTQTGKLKWLRYLVGIIMMMVTLISSWFLAQLITPMANDALDFINKLIENLP